jgi:hypothetical protein
MAHMKNRDSNRRRREDRQVQAKVRQEAYDKLSMAEKLAKLPEQGSMKQKIKLAKQAVAKVGEAAAKVAEAVIEVAEAPAKEKKGTKARRQAKKDKKAQ